MAMELTLRSLEDHPELFDEFLELDRMWPSFMLQDPYGLLLGRVGISVASHSFVVTSGDEVVGRVISVPVHWSIEDELPSRGWDAAIEACVEHLAMDLPARCLCALEITLHDHARGMGLSTKALELLRRSAIERSFEGLIAPVRPVRKSRYPRLAMTDYLDQCTKGLLDEDPWLRVHRELGAEVDSIAELSMTISATFETWRDWTGIDPAQLGEDAMQVDGGLTPVILDHHNRIGVYVEPNIWCRHRLPADVSAIDPLHGRIDLRDYDSVPVPPEITAGWSVDALSSDAVLEAESLEYEVFFNAGFCEFNPRRRVMEYEPWRDRSEYVAVRSPGGQIEGVVRMLFGKYEELPIGAFTRNMMYPEDPVLEYASLSVRSECRKTGVAEWLYRAVWQQVLRNGASGMVAIGEDWLMKILNDTYGLGFEQLGEARWYMGGECFPMGTGVAELVERLKRQPSFFRWAAAEIDLRDLPRPDVRSAVSQLRTP